MKVRNEEVEIGEESLDSEIDCPQKKYINVVKHIGRENWKAVIKLISTLLMSKKMEERLF